MLAKINIKNLREAICDGWEQVSSQLDTCHPDPSHPRTVATVDISHPVNNHPDISHRRTIATLDSSHPDYCHPDRSHPGQ